ncbi:MAG: DNA polymerase I, partial [Comamonas sp.]|nr:DNA polymerase I [Comamonas sp.]
MSNSKTLVLVDGSSYLYRAYHAMPDLRAIPGDPASPATGAIRGMVNMMQALRKDVQADYAVCVFDASGPTFRDEMYTEYKATRSPMPDDLRSQIEPIHEVVQLLGWKVVAVPGVEADDVIATLAQTAAAQGINVIVSSGDKDLSQLVGEHVTIIDTMNGKKRDVAGVTAEFGVPPALMIDYQALVGDTVDNVPGVTKVGPKTAAKWLEEHGSLDNLIARAADIKGVAGQNLRDAIASGQLALSRQLVTMKTDCDLSAYIGGLPQLDAVTLAEPDSAALAPFYEKYGFKGLVRTLGAAAAEAKAAKPGKAAKVDSAQGGLFDADDAAATEVAVTAQQRDVVYTTILSEAQFDEWLAKIDAAELTALDTETDSLDEMVARIVGISFSVAVGEAAYIPLRHEGMDVPEQLDLDRVLARLKPWLEDAGKKKLGQHVKYDQHVFANHGITVRGYAHDTMLQSYVLEADRPHNLTSLALRHVGRSGISYEDLCGKGKSQIPFAQVSVDKAAAYSCEDSDQTLDVHGVLWPRIQANAGL